MPTGKDKTTEIWEVGKLQPHPRNAKKHPPEHLKKLAASIKRLGLANPPHVEPDGTIIAGHGRWLSVKQELGWEKIPVIVRHDLTKTEADALRLSDNETVWNEYDEKMRAEELQNIVAQDRTLALDAGFKIEELERTTAESAAELNESAFVEDITEAVEEQKTANKAKEAEVDVTAAPIGDAFGFKRMSVAQSRTVREWMSGIEIMTGKVGAEALVDFIETSK